MVRGHHEVRNCIKECVRKVENHCANDWGEQPCLFLSNDEERGQLKCNVVRDTFSKACRASM